MQFRESANGKRIEILAYRGYSKEKKRSIVERLGSVTADTAEPITAGLVSSMSAEECQEFQQWRERYLQELELNRLQSFIDDFDSNMQKIATCIKDGDITVSQEWCDSAFDSWDMVKSAMRKQGLKRSRKSAPADQQAGPDMFDRIP